MAEQNFSKAGFSFSGTGLSALVETQYTLVQIIVDITGSVSSFVDVISRMLQAVTAKLKTIDTSDNLLLRVTYFNSAIGVKETHGFRLMENIDPANDYPSPVCGSLTNLYDATADGVDALDIYASELAQKRYRANSINFIITDGDDNDSKSTMLSVKQKYDVLQSKEILDSVTLVLIAINAKDPGYAARLDSFSKTIGMDKFIDISDIDAALDTLVEYIVTTTESTTQVVGTGGKSQDLGNF
jgi:hypothetical protein